MNHTLFRFLQGNNFQIMLHYHTHICNFRIVHLFDSDYSDSDSDSDDSEIYNYNLLFLFFFFFKVLYQLSVQIETHFLSKHEDLYYVCVCLYTYGLRAI